LKAGFSRFGTKKELLPACNGIYQESQAILGPEERCLSGAVNTTEEGAYSGMAVVPPHRESPSSASHCIQAALCSALHAWQRPRSRVTRCRLSRREVHNSLLARRRCCRRPSPRRTLLSPEYTAGGKDTVPRGEAVQGRSDLGRLSHRSPADPERVSSSEAPTTLMVRSDNTAPHSDISCPLTHKLSHLVTTTAATTSWAGQKPMSAWSPSPAEL